MEGYHQLELKLGPPGEEEKSPLSLGYISSNTHKRVFQHTVEGKGGEIKWLSHNKQPKPSFLQYPIVPKNLAVMGDGSSQPGNSRVEQLQCQEKKACGSTPVNGPPNTSTQRRIAMPPVVGWPPVRSFRKNLATNISSKMGPESSTDIPKEGNGGKLSENIESNLFVKINMDGIPIGRKIDLKAFDNYEKLSSAVDELFRGLLAAQRDSSAASNKNKMEKTKAITGLLDGMGEYTLVYEDNEGDRMLVGDVPWDMFISSAKRLRVLKRSELSALQLSSNKLARTPLDSAVKQSCTYPTA